MHVYVMIAEVWVVNNLLQSKTFGKSQNTGIDYFKNIHMGNADGDFVINNFDRLYFFCEKKS